MNLDTLGGSRINLDNLGGSRMNLDNLGGSRMNLDNLDTVLSRENLQHARDLSIASLNMARSQSMPG